MMSGGLGDSGFGFQPEWDTTDRKAPSNVRAFVTYRAEGFSLPPYDKNNLAFHVGDVAEAVEKNRQALSKRLHIASTIGWLNQIHSDRIVTENEFLSSGIHPVEADGVVASSSQLACAIMTADCLPVLFCNEQGTRVAAIHAGWRGLANGILKKAVKMFKNNNAGELLVFIGPGISQQCYEVGEEVVSALEKTVSLDKKEFSMASSLSESKLQKTNKYYLDMVAVAKTQLVELGVTKISGGNRCSFSEAANFYSYRRDGQTGRMASLIWLES